MDLTLTPKPWDNLKSEALQRCAIPGLRILPMQAAEWGQWLAGFDRLGNLLGSLLSCEGSVCLNSSVFQKSSLSLSHRAFRFPGVWNPRCGGTCGDTVERIIQVWGAGILWCGHVDKGLHQDT